MCCGAEGARGLWYCLNCWEPITWAGVQDRQGFLKDDTARINELRYRYGLSSSESQKILDAPGHAVNPLPHVPYERRAGETLPIKAPCPPRTAAAAAPAAAAPVWRPAGAAARWAGQSLTNEKIKRLNQAAKKHNFRSHTDRYHRDPEYRSSCLKLDPPTPEWLQYSTGVWAREDGND